jgi:glycerol uptake facilitator-like aquaporin
MQKYISEFIGTFILLVSIVGSGIAGQQYTNDQMVILVSHAVVIVLTLILLLEYLLIFLEHILILLFQFCFSYKKS